MQRAKYTESAGGVVVNDHTGEVLVVRQENNVWSLPKGHIEKTEDPLVAAKREIFEESGISKLRLLEELGKYKRFKIGPYSQDDESEIKNIRMYLFTTDEDTLRPLDKGVYEARWMDRADVSELLTHKKDKEFFESVRSKLPVIEIPE